MRQTVSEANKFLRQTVKSVEAGGVATLAQAMEHPGTLQEVHVTTLDAADAEIPAAAGFSEGVKLPTRIETKKLVIVGKFPIATQAEYDALSDAMKDKAVILNVTECPIGSEVKAIECNALGVPVDAHMWIMGADGWKGGSSSTLSPDGSTSFARPVRVEGDLEADSASFAGTVQALQIIRSTKARSAGSSLFYAAPTATSASAWTVGEQIPVAAPYWGVQPIFVNNNKDAVMSVGAAKIASAPTDNAAAEGLTWASLTVGLATTFDVPAATPDLSTGVLKMGLLEGDPIPLASVARTDFPANSPLLHYRGLYPSGGKFSAIASGNIAALRASTGLEYSSYLANSDQVTAPTGSPTIDSAAYRGVMFKFLFKSPVFDLLVIGDSTNAGTGSNSSIFTAAREAKRLASFPMEVVNFAIGGQTMRYAYNHWRAIIASGYRPRAVLVPTWTVNTSLNAAGFANTITYAMTIASEAMDLGIIPILQTPPPASSLTGGNIALWQAHYAMVLALNGQYIVVDQTKSVMDPNSPAHYLAALTADGLHPNEAGYVAKGVDLLPVLERIAQ